MVRFRLRVRTDIDLPFMLLVESGNKFLHVRRIRPRDRVPERERNVCIRLQLVVAAVAAGGKPERAAQREHEHNRRFGKSFHFFLLNRLYFSLMARILERSTFGLWSKSSSPLIS